MNKDIIKMEQTHKDITYVLKKREVKWKERRREQEDVMKNTEKIHLVVLEINCTNEIRDECDKYKVNQEKE